MFNIQFIITYNLSATAYYIFFRFAFFVSMRFVGNGDIVVENIN